MKAFILRPLGNQDGIDFDQLEHSLLRPALQSVGATTIATATLRAPGLFAELLTADLVIALIGQINPANLYELSIRQALKAETTLLLDSCAVSLPELMKRLRDMAPPQQDQRTPVPPDFVAEATPQGPLAKLILFGLEVQDTTWQVQAFTRLASSFLALEPKNIWDEVILFTGHRIDTAGRETPRFPAAMESVARDAIRRSLQDHLPNYTAAKVLAVAGGAAGGDLLFLEVCQDLGIKTELALPLPAGRFVEASFDNDHTYWLERFHRQLQKHGNVPILAAQPELPAWLRFKNDYDLWQRNNLWLLSNALSQRALHRTVIALWDGETGDGPGGTEHMVSLATARAAQFIWLNTKQLFGLAAQTGLP